jgi:hypothetical protein
MNGSNVPGGCLYIWYIYIYIWVYIYLHLYIYIYIYCISVACVIACQGLHERMWPSLCTETLWLIFDRGTWQLGLAC